MYLYARLSLFGCAVVLALSIVLVQPCMARIVYTQTNQTISGDDASLAIDLNHDGVADVTIQLAMSTMGCDFDWADALPRTGNAIVSNTQGLDGYWASALNIGALIWQGSSYAPGLAIMTDVDSGFGCPFPHGYGYWGNSGPHYLGVAFVKNGRVHYAWAQLQVSFVNSRWVHSITATLTGYAYQTIAGKLITAGHT